MEEKNGPLFFLSDGGEMGELTRTYDWASTPLGSPDNWQGSLRTTLGIVLHSAFPMFLFWGEDLICFYNDPFRPSLGIDGKHPALGKKGKQVWAEIWDFIGPLIQQVMTTGKPVWFEDQLVPFYRNGRIEDIYWTFSYSPAYGDDGLISGVVVTCTETTRAVQTRKALEESVTDLNLATRKLEENEKNMRNTMHQIEELVAERTRELADANRNLARSNAELSQFAHVASHDLQEPIRKITTYTDLLESRLSPTDAGSKSYLTKISAAGNRMGLLVRDILAYSELSESTPSFEPVNLDQVVREILEEFDLLIEQKQARINVGKLPTLTANPLQMRQLFGNLLSNALKYSKAGIPPVIDIGAKPEGSRWQISVADNGIGFEPKHAQQIFSIFQRLHNKTEYSGTGIGLAICHKIALNHHGEIYATGRPGEGATFHVLLPA